MRKKRAKEGKTEEIRRKGRKEVVKEDEEESKNKKKQKQKRKSLVNMFF